MSRPHPTASYHCSHLPFEKQDDLMKRLLEKHPTRHKTALMQVRMWICSWEKVSSFRFAMTIQIIYLQIHIELNNSDLATHRKSSFREDNTSLVPAYSASNFCCYFPSKWCEI
jgi:hypothetical protein